MKPMGVDVSSGVTLLLPLLHHSTHAWNRNMALLRLDTHRWKAKSAVRRRMLLSSRPSSQTRRGLYSDLPALNVYDFVFLRWRWLYTSCARDHIPANGFFFWQLLEAEIIQQTCRTCPLPSPYTEHAGAVRCGGMHPQGSPEAPLEPRREVGPPGPIKTSYHKKNNKTIWGDMVPGAWHGLARIGSRKPSEVPSFLSPGICSVGTTLAFL